MLLSDDFHVRCFGEYKNYVNHIVQERKVRFSNRIQDIEQYVDRLVTDGINDLNTAEYEIYRDYDISSEVISWKRGIAIGKAICTVDNIEVSSANMKITIPEILNSFLPK